MEAADIVFAARPGTNGDYIFKHALISEAIYSTIPKRYRTTLHAAAAQVLLSDTSRNHDAEVAQHFKSASAYDNAAQYFERSDDKAARVVANAEPISQYSQALNMVRQLPYSQALLRSELSLNRKIVAQFIGLRGIPTDEAKPFFAAAQSLSAELDDQEEAVNASWGLWSIQLMVAELDACL